MSDPFKDFLEELERRRTNGAPQPTEASESEPDSDAPPTRTRARRPGGGAPSGPRPTFKLGFRTLFLPILLVLVLVGGPIIALLTDARWFESLGAGALYWQRLQLQTLPIKGACAERFKPARIGEERNDRSPNQNEHKEDR